MMNVEVGHKRRYEGHYETMLQFFLFFIAKYHAIFSRILLRNMLNIYGEPSP